MATIVKFKPKKEQHTTYTPTETKPKTNGKSLSYQEAMLIDHIRSIPEPRRSQVFAYVQGTADFYKCL